MRRTGELTGLLKKTLLHGQYLELKLIHYTGQLPGSKSTTIWDNSRDRSSVRVTQAAACDRSAALALGKKTPSPKTCTSPPIFSNHP
jgi:hypothetical protein